MPYVSFTEILTYKNVTYWINARKSGLYTDMLYKIIEQLTAVQSHHSKMHVIRFDLHLKQDSPTNEIITIFLRRLIKWVKRNYNIIRVGYIWVREQEISPTPHYHFALMLNGREVNKPNRVWSRVSHIWCCLGGSAYLPKNSYYNVHRGNHDELQAVIYRLSYFAKARGKDKKPMQTKNYSTSRIKHRELQH